MEESRQHHSDDPKAVAVIFDHRTDLQIVVKGQRMALFAALLEVVLAVEQKSAGLRCYSSSRNLHLALAIVDHRIMLETRCEGRLSPSLTHTSVVRLGPTSFHINYPLTHLMSIGPWPLPPPITCAKPDRCPGRPCPPSPGAPPKPAKTLLPDDGMPKPPHPPVPLPRPLLDVFCSRRFCLDGGWEEKAFVFMDLTGCGAMPALGKILLARVLHSSFPVMTMVPLLQDRRGEPCARCAR